MNHRRHDPVQRVNSKHPDDLLAMARTLGHHPDATAARAERVDRYGLDLVVTTPGGSVETRIDFTEPVSNPKWMRTAFKDLASRAQAALADGTGPPAT